LKKNNEIYYRIRSLINYEYRDIEGAIKDCDYAIEKLNDTNSLLLRAQFQIENEKYEEALADCNKYLSFKKDQIGFAEFLKGKAYIKLANIDSASYYLDKALLKGFTLSNEEKYRLERVKDEIKREEEMKRQYDYYSKDK
jgi:hypothetical protein